MALDTRLPLMNVEPDAAGALTGGLGLGMKMAEARQVATQRDQQITAEGKLAKQRDLITAFSVASEFDPEGAADETMTDAVGVEFVQPTKTANYLNTVKTLESAGISVPEDAREYTPQNAMELRQMIDAGGQLFQQQQAASGGASSFQWGASYVSKEGDDSYLVSQKRNPNTGVTELSKTLITGKLADDLGLTAEQKSDLDVETKQRETEVVEQTKVDVKVKPENVKRVADSQARIAAMTETAKLNARDAGNLRSTDTMREFNIKKAESFLDGFISGDRNSGVGRKASSYLPIGVWTTQGEFDEKLDAFAETAAREKLKASGEIRPTDADVQGMKQAMFGIGRDEDVNIQLLEEYIMEQKALSERLDAYDAKLNQDQLPSPMQAKREELQSQFSTPQAEGESYDQRAARLLN